MRIIGGSEAEVNEYPWMVSLQFEGIHQCGGSLISDRWILSAAHCFKNRMRKKRNPRNWIAVLGEHDFKTDDEADHIEIKISRIYIHPDYYKEVRFNYDFALLRMRRKVDFSTLSHIHPICLPKDDSDSFANAISIATGWGLRREGISSSVSTKLLEVTLETLPNDACAHDYGYSPLQITDQMICANAINGGKGTCQYDSGNSVYTDRLD